MFSVLNCYIISDEFNFFVILHGIYTVFNFLTPTHHHTENRPILTIIYLVYSPILIFLLLTPHHPCIINKLPVVTPHMIITGKALTQLKVNKASNPDELSNRLLKELANQLAPLLIIIFQERKTGNQKKLFKSVIIYLSTINNSGFAQRSDLVFLTLGNSQLHPN